MNRNTMIGAVVAIVVVIILVVVFVMGGDDDENGDNGDGGLTSETMTSAWEAILDGDPEPAKAISCEDDHPNIEAAAEGMSAAVEAAGDDAEVSVSCEVAEDTASCDLTVLGETNTIVSQIVDGQVCGELEVEE